MRPQIKRICFIYSLCIAFKRSEICYVSFSLNIWRYISVELYVDAEYTVNYIIRILLFVHKYVD